MTVTSLVFACVAATSSPAPVTTIDESLRATLLQMGRDDQAWAGRITRENAQRKDTPAETLYWSELHVRNGELLRAIVTEHGWPGRRLAGADGAHAAWLVVQHMDEDLEFQRSCLALVEAAFLAGDVGAQEYAYLTDRVRSKEGRKQMYGTQGIGVTSPEDEARVDANRAAIGLPPWRIAVERRQKEYAADDGAGAAKAP
jgi:hypothetical protein